MADESASSPLVYLKIHHAHKSKVTAVCDCELLGQTFTDEKRGIKLETHPSFYQGERVTVQEGVEAIRAADNVNLVGARIISAVLEDKLANEHAVLTIQTKQGKVPHLQIYHL
jgi:hypothetical protein